ncbi:class I SAM-dependent methyltransferase [Arthrobacter rhizosphaerae]|uniref:class I SAM-dependent methyltransferase n=1 Tax=Arthrobacter rhizosphaerae TaxID=2855490 RepID=UPI001FF6AD83|nr:class I SAM-dependent methyltransferase [Arthrobacter rhizosphaerae]
MLSPSPSVPEPVMALLRERAVDAVEEMDADDCDPVRLENTYAQFALVNRLVSGWRRLYRKQLLPRLSATTPTTLLDIGCGGGDVPVLLAAWAARDGKQLLVTAIDPDERAYRFAAGRPATAGVTFRQASSAELVSEGLTFDVVISNHVLHHVPSAGLQQFLAESASLSRGFVIHNDLRRSPIAYAVFSVAALPLRRSFIRQDGLTSIRRSYTPQELNAVTPPGWVAERRFPFRTVLHYRVPQLPEALNP